MPKPNPFGITLSEILRHVGDKLTAIEEDDMLGETVQPLRKAIKTGFPGL